MIKVDEDVGGLLTGVGDGVPDMASLLADFTNKVPRAGLEPADGLLATPDFESGA